MIFARSHYSGNGSTYFFIELLYMRVLEKEASTTNFKSLNINCLCVLGRRNTKSQCLCLFTLFCSFKHVSFSVISGNISFTCCNLWLIANKTNSSSIHPSESYDNILGIGWHDLIEVHVICNLYGQEQMRYNWCTLNMCHFIR